MAKTYSTMLPLGSIAPNFTLLNTNPFFNDGKTKIVNFADYNNYEGYLIVFICNHCPYVKHIANQLSEITRNYLSKKILTFAISSNDIEHYPEDSPEKMAIEAKKYNYSFPYLYDDKQSVAKAYQAACTPDFFLFDKNKRCFYRGQMDDSRPKTDIPVTAKDLKTALGKLLVNEPIEASEQKPSLGCNIKWIPGNEPDYY